MFFNTSISVFKTDTGLSSNPARDAFNHKASVKQRLAFYKKGDNYIPYVEFHCDMNQVSIHRFHVPDEWYFTINW